MRNDNLVKAVKTKYLKNREEYGSFDYDSRVHIEPSAAHRGEVVKINYKGLLKNSGAHSIYLHYGYDQWNMPQTVRMDKNEDGSFRADILAKGDRELNFCFKDCANNWDNNAGSNWTIPVQ